MLRTRVNGELRREHATADLVFTPVELVRYISEFTTLEPGDVIITGTPEGVGAGSERFLSDGDVVTVEIDGLGSAKSSVCIPVAVLAVEQTAPATAHCQMTDDREGSPRSEPELARSAPKIHDTKSGRLVLGGHSRQSVA